MRSMSSLGIGLSLVFGSLLLALVAELYYLLWWKKRMSNREIEGHYSSSGGREFFYLFCWKKPSSLSSTALNPQQLCTSVAHVHDSENQLHLQSKDFLFKSFEENDVDAELMRLHNLAGPPRFLFTIKEETKEDLESDDGKSRGDKSHKGSRTRSLSDILLTVETPFLTPLSSPPFFTPPLTPLDTYNHHGFNPLFESSADVEVTVTKSPPPKFKFLKDAEDKLYRRKLVEEAEKRVKALSDQFLDKSQAPPVSSTAKQDEEDGSFITIMVGNSNQEKELQHHHHHSTSSQVLPLSSSPSTFTKTYKKPMFH